MSLALTLRICQQKLDRLYEQELVNRGGGITPTQLLVLSSVLGTNGIKQVEIRRRCNVDRSTLSEILTRLRDQGLVFHARSDDDARASVVRLSSEGVKALKAGRKAAQNAENLFLLGFPRAMRDGLLAGLEYAAKEKMNA